MTDIVLDDVASGFNLSVINDNFEVVKNVINDDLVHLEGGNNVMRQNLDMNSRRLLNLPSPSTPSEPVRLSDLQAVISGGIDDASLINYTPAGTGSQVRTVKSRLDDIVYVNNFDGVVPGQESTVGIQAAIDSLSEYSTLVIDDTYYINDTLYITTNNITIKGCGKIIAEDLESFEYMIFGTGLSGVVIEGISLDVNKAGREASQDVRFMGAAFIASEECGFVNVTVSGALGFAGTSAVALVAAGQSTRCFIHNCLLKDCGESGKDADGIFTSGTQNIISCNRAYNCTDTAFVIENSNYSVISSCSSYDCASPAAVTLAGNDDKRGNVIVGLTARNWDAPSTGAIQVGCLSGTGNLYDTSISGVVMYADTGAGYGSGAGIWVRKVATGEAIGVNISSIVVNGSSYGVRVDDGDNVSVSSSTIKNTLVASTYFVNGSDHSVKSSHLEGGDYGVLTANTSVVDVFSCTLKGQSVSALSALNTSTINNHMNIYRSLTGNRTSKDVGASINSVGMINEQLVLSNILNNTTVGTQVRKVELYNADASSMGFIYIYDS